MTPAELVQIVSLGASMLTLGAVLVRTGRIVERLDALTVGAAELRGRLGLVETDHVRLRAEHDSCHECVR